MTAQVADQVTDHQARRARRVAVFDEEPLIAGRRYDYADAFEIRMPEPAELSAEQFTRLAIEEAPRAVGTTVAIVHRYLLRLRLGPRSSPEHLMGWRIVTSEPDVIHLEAESPLLGRGAIVGRRLSPTRTVVTTYLFYARPNLSRAVWAVVGPLHRRVAPFLMEHAAAHAASRSANVPLL